MLHSQRLRLRDIRAVYELLGECRELGADPRAWREHMGEVLCRLTGAQVAIGATLDFSCGIPEPDPGSFFDEGWATDAEQRAYREHLSANDCPEEPCLAAVLQRYAASPQQVITRRRPELLPDEQWYRSPFFHRYWVRCRLDHPLPSMARLRDRRGRLHGFALYRPLGDRPFQRRQRRLVHLFHLEAARELDRRLRLSAPANADPLADLSPRLRQVLACLLRGDSEKQVARRLGLSPNTVHHYVKDLHRRFNVRSRGELLARFVQLPPQLDGESQDTKGIDK